LVQYYFEFVHEFWLSGCILSIPVRFWKIFEKFDFGGKFWRDENSRYPTGRIIEMEIRAVIRYLTLKGMSSDSIHTELKDVYGADVCSLPMVKKWRKRFREGRTDLGDDPRSGRPRNDDVITVVSNLLQEQPFVSCKAMQRVLGIPKTTIHRILHSSLGLKILISGGFHTNFLSCKSRKESSAQEASCEFYAILHKEISSQAMSPGSSMICR